MKLYKIFAITFLLTTIPFSIFSQEKLNKGGYNIGFEGGVQFSDVNDPLLIVSKSGLGYNFGPLFEYYISESLKLKLASHFENRKFELGNGTQKLANPDSNYVSQTSYYEVNEKYSANYLNIPISVVFERGSEKLKLFVQGTLYFSLLLNSEQTGERYIYISEEDAGKFFDEDHPELSVPGFHILEPDTKPLNTNDMGINAFIGIRYNISPKISMYVSPGITMSFSNVWEDPARNASWTGLYKFTGGISYKLK